MPDEHLQGDRLRAGEGIKEGHGKVSGNPEAIKEAQRRKEAERREAATGALQEVLFGEAPGAEDDADGIV